MVVLNWSPRADSNRRPSPYQGCPLPGRASARSAAPLLQRTCEDWTFYLQNFLTTCGKKMRSSEGKVPMAGRGSRDPYMWIVHGDVYDDRR